MKKEYFRLDNFSNSHKNTLNCYGFATNYKNILVFDRENFGKEIIKKLLFINKDFNYSLKYKKLYDFQPKITLQTLIIYNEKTDDILHEIEFLVACRGLSRWYMTIEDFEVIEKTIFNLTQEK